MRNKYGNALYSKTGEAALVIASDLLTYKVGDKIKTVDQYLVETNFSRGTLYNALSIIAEYELAKFEKRGQLGTFIVNIEYHKIWQFLNISSINIIMPLPYSKHYEGLATGFYRVFNDLNIPLSILFLRGSNKRLAALKNNVADIIVISYLSAKSLIKDSHNIEILHILNDKSYLNKQVLLVAPKNNNVDIFKKDCLKILLDKDSLDMKFFAKTVFKDKPIEFVISSYNQSLENLINEDIDAAFWNKDELNKNINLKMIDLKDHLIHDHHIKDSSRACLISDANNDAVKNLIKNKINFEKVEQILEKVTKGDETPFY